MTSAVDGATVGTRFRPQRNASAEAVLRALLSFGPTARKRLAARTGLSTTTITSVVNDLLTSGAIVEANNSNREVRRGRPETPLMPNAPQRIVVATYIRPFESVCALYDITGRQLSQKASPHPPGRQPADVIRDSIDLTRGVLASSPFPPIAVGLSTSGHVDAERGVVVDNPFGWVDIPVRDLFESGLGQRTIFDSSWRAYALSQAWTDGDWDSTVLTVFMGRILGAALVQRGSIYRGGTVGVAGVLDHFPATKRGPRCACGSDRCLGTVAALETSLVEAVSKRLLPSGATVDDLRGPGAGLARLRQRRAATLGCSLHPLIEFINPDRVMLLGLVGDKPEIDELLDCAAGGRDTPRRPTMTHGEVDGAGWVRGAAALVVADYLSRPFDYEAEIAAIVQTTKNRK